MQPTMFDSLSEIILATGALGTAAFGIVEGIKWFKLIGEAGFAAIISTLGPIFDLLAVAYGADVEKLLRAQYRGEQSELARVMRQGVRIGLTPTNASTAAASLGSIDPDLLRDAAAAVAAGTELPPTLRNVLGKFELAVDARIDAALALAQDHYKRAAMITAAFIAIAIATWVGLRLQNPVGGVLVGIAAVPLAPIAKDVASALKAAAEAIRGRT
jgi:hypothetical protein